MLRALSEAGSRLLDDQRQRPMPGDDDRCGHSTEIVEGGGGRRSVGDTDPAPIGLRYEIIADQRIVGDRFVHNNHRIESTGNSLRRHCPSYRRPKSLDLRGRPNHLHCPIRGVPRRWRLRIEAATGMESEWRPASPDSEKWDLTR